MLASAGTNRFALALCSIYVRLRGRFGVGSKQIGYIFEMTVERAKLPVDAKAIANLMLDWAEADAIPVSPMKLQKLLYFCHADMLSHFGVPLIKQSFEAWDYGPVIPSVYKEFKCFKDKPIGKRAVTFDPITATSQEARCDLADSDKQKLRQLFDFYKPFEATRLSDVSHHPQGAWRQARSLFSNGLNANRTISNELICRFHQFVHN
jgi:uncharacterized phage-associated protein